MGKFLLELALFAGILCQIAMLANHTGAAPSSIPKVTNLASIESMYNGTSYTMDPYAVAPHISNTSILQDMARKEAERIVRTGDYESFQKKLEEHDVLLKLMQHGL